MAEFIPCVRVYKPSEKAPAFIKVNGEIDGNDLDLLIQFVLNHAVDGKIRFVVKESREGKYYMTLDDYRGAAKGSGKPEVDEEAVPF